MLILSQTCVLLIAHHLSLQIIALGLACLGVLSLSYSLDKALIGLVHHFVLVELMQTHTVSNVCLNVQVQLTILMLISLIELVFSNVLYLYMHIL